MILEFKSQKKNTNKIINTGSGTKRSGCEIVNLERFGSKHILIKHLVKSGM